MFVYKKKCKSYYKTVTKQVFVCYNARVIKIGCEKMAQQNLVKEPMQRQNKNRPPMKKKWRFNKKFKRNMLVLMLVFLLFAVIKAIVSEAKENKKSSSSDDNYSEQKVNLKSLKCLDDVQNTSVKIDKYFIYGTYFNLEGSLDIPNSYKVKKASLVLRKDSGKEREYSIKYKVDNRKLTFKASEKINEGIYLEDIEKGNYYLILKLLYDDNSTEYFSILNNTEYKNTQYYTITRNKSNKKIDIFSGEYKDKKCLICSSALKKAVCQTMFMTL